MKTDPSTPQVVDEDPTISSVATFLGELAVMVEERKKAPHPPARTIMTFPVDTLAALIEVARRVQRLDHRISAPDGPYPEHLIQGDLVDDEVPLNPEDCPVCALGRLTEGRAE